MGSRKERFEKMTPEEQNQQNIQSLIASLVFGRFHSGSISPAEPFSEEYLAEYAKYREISDVSKKENSLDAFKRAGIPTGIGSPGFGYDKEIEQALISAGFSEGVKVGVVVLDSNGYSDRDLSEENIKEYGATIVDHFSSLGIRCKAVKGGSFPDKMNGVAVILDIHDSEFLNKIKPDFMSQFPIYEGEQLSRPNHQYGTEDLQNYASLILKSLAEMAGNAGVELDIDPIKIESDVPDNVVSMSEHKMEMFEGGLYAMIPALSKDEVRTVIVDIMDRVATPAPDNSKFKQIRRLALA